MITGRVPWEESLLARDLQVEVITSSDTSHSAEASEASQVPRIGYKELRDHEYCHGAHDDGTTPYPV